MNSPTIMALAAGGRWGFILRDDDVLKSHALAHGLRTPN